jgi:hypothetical protein
MAAAPFAALVPLLLPTEDISDCIHTRLLGIRGGPSNGMGVHKYSR